MSHIFYTLPVSSNVIMENLEEGYHSAIVFAECELVPFGKKEM